MQASDTHLFDGEYHNPGYAADHGPTEANILVSVVATLNFAGDDHRWTTIAAYPDGNGQRPVLRLMARVAYLSVPIRVIYYRWLRGVRSQRVAPMSGLSGHRWSKESLYTGRGIFSGD